MRALREQYGYETLECLPPAVKKIEYKDGCAYIYTTEGAMVAGTTIINGFEIAGKDECYYPAKVLVDRRNGYMTVSSGDVPAPVAVRYGFRNFCRQSFINWMGIPALPFRTENWDYKDQQ